MLAGLRDVVVTFLLGMLVVSVAPVLLGWRTTVVVSGSMAPAIKPGDVVIAAAAPGNGSRIALGRVVLVDDPEEPGTYLMHRLVRYDAQGRLILKGDANPTADSTPVPAENVRGLPRARLPAVGLPFLWVQQGKFLTAMAAGFILLVLVAWQPPPGRPSPGRRREAGIPGGPPDLSALTAISQIPLDALSYRFPEPPESSRRARNVIPLATELHTGKTPTGASSCRICV